MRKSLKKTRTLSQWADKISRLRLESLEPRLLLSDYSTLPNGMPILDSYPSAPVAIYFDNDGDPSYGGVQPFDLDGNPTTFNAAEQDVIYKNWLHLSIYYAMFNVNVTTIQPNVATTPTAWIAYGVNPSTQGGLSQVNVFPNSSCQSVAGGGFGWQIGDTLAHEIGHNFGSWHTSQYDDWGNKTLEYSDALDPLHGPLMGTNQSSVISKWTIWHGSANDSGVADPGFLLDNMAKIAQDLDNYGGDGYRPDDFGGTTATAHPLDVTGVTQSHVGIIERLNDADAFSFTSTGGRYSITARRDVPSGVDLKLSIYDSSGTLIAFEDGDPRAQPYTMVNDQHLTLDLVAGTYYAIIESHGNYGDQGQYVLRVDKMAAAWNSEDIGMVGLPGYSSFDPTTGIYTVAGSGADVWGNSDSFRFLYQTLSGNGSITVRVDSMTNTASWAKSGIMFRESLAANSKEAYLVMTPSNGAQWSARTTTGGSTSAYTPNTGTNFSPTYLRITRAGNTFTAYKSTNGTSWSPFGSPLTVSMNSQVYIGLLSSAVNNTAVNVGTFSNVALTGTLNPEPVLNELPAPALSLSGATSSSIQLNWSNIDGETGYSIERSSDNVNFKQIGTTAVDVTAYTDNGLSDAQRYFYRVRALGSGGTVSAPSEVASALTRAGAISNLHIISYTTSKLVLDWTDASGETNYRVERSPTGTGNWTTVTTLGKNIPLYANSGLTANTQYFYRVVTVDGSGDAATSAVVSRYTRLSAASGLTFTAKAPKQISIAWNAVAGATNYRVERSTDGITYSTLASNLSATNYTDNAVTPLGEYYYRVVGVNSNTEGVLSTVIFTAAPAAAALPTPWLTTDIGSVGGTGGAKYNNGTFTLVGGGAEIFWGNDEFRYVYKTLSGNGSLTARVTSVEETNYWAKAGLMIRESTATNAKHAMVYISPHLAVFQSRTTAGGNVTDVYGPYVTAPYYVRITRNGSLFTGEISSNGTTWTTVGSQTISMNTDVLIGFALTSRDDNYLNTSTFTITPEANAAPTVATAAAATPSPAIGTTAALSALGADDHGEANLTYTWSATTVPSGAPTPTYSVNGINAAKNTTVTFGKAGSYVFRVTIADTSGLSVTSTVNVTVNQTLTSIAVSPVSVSLLGGQTWQFTATGYDQFGAVMSPQPAFTWSASSGSINASTGLFTAPYTPGATVTITVTSGSFQKSATAIIGNTPPSGILLSNSLLDENQAGTIVGTLTTVDPDEGQTYAYLLQNDPTNKFEIVDAILRLKAGQSLDYETFPSVDLQIRTTDSGGLSYTKTLPITIVDQTEMLAAGTADWTDAGLTLTLGGDGKLHLYRTGTTTDAVPPHNPAKVAGLNLVGRGIDDILIDDYSAVFADLLLDHATLLADRDNAFSSDTNITVNGGILNLNGHNSPLGNLTLNNDGQAYFTTLNNATTTVASGTLTAASIVCDTLTIGSSAVTAAIAVSKDAAMAPVAVVPQAVRSAEGVFPTRLSEEKMELDSALIDSAMVVPQPITDESDPTTPPATFTADVPLAAETLPNAPSATLVVSQTIVPAPIASAGQLPSPLVTTKALPAVKFADRSAHAISKQSSLADRLKDAFFRETANSLAGMKTTSTFALPRSRSLHLLALQAIMKDLGSEDLLARFGTIAVKEKQPPSSSVQKRSDQTVVLPPGLTTRLAPTDI